MNDLRRLVLDAALAQALRTVHAVRSAGLQSGSIDEQIDVADTSWHIEVGYSVEYDTVRIQGRPQRASVGLLALFSQQQQEDGEDEVSGGHAFDLYVPAPWLEAAAAEVHP